MTSQITLAQRLCANDSISFEECFRYQYLITRNPIELPGFSSRLFGSFNVLVGGSLRIEEIYDTTGQFFGLILGIAVASNGKSFADQISQDFDLRSETARQDFEDLLIEATGRFVVLNQVNGEYQLYQDASGMLGALHNADENWIASTLFLSLSDKLCLNTNFFDEASGKPIIEPIFHHTPDARVVRINPSFRYNLENQTSERFWPRPDDKFEITDENYVSVLDEIIEKQDKILTALCDLGPISLSMSGGFDSRTIFACAAPETRTRFSQVFTHISRKIGWHDAHIAAQVLSIEKMGIEILACVRPRTFVTGKQQTELIRKYEVASGTLHDVPSEVENGISERVRRDAIVLRGQQIPVLRGLGIGREPVEKWNSSYVLGQILKMHKASEIPSHTLATMRKTVSTIYDTLPHNAKSRSIDILLVEGVNGPELSGSFGGFTNAFYISPFNSRRYIQLFASFQREDRASKDAHFHLLMRAEPKLAGVAFAGQMKRMNWREPVTSLLARFSHLRILRKKFLQKTGHTLSPFSVPEYFLGTGGRVHSWRTLRKMISEQTEQSTAVEETE